jgi:hypothetical protein
MQALSSNLIYLPSGLLVSLRVRTIKAFFTSPLRICNLVDAANEAAAVADAIVEVSCEIGFAFLITTVIGSPVLKKEMKVRMERF